MNVLVIRVKKPEEMDDALVRLNQVLGPRLGFDPEDTARLRRLEHGRGTEDGSEDPARLRDLLRRHRRADARSSAASASPTSCTPSSRSAPARSASRWRSARAGAGSPGPFVLEGLVYTLVGGLFGALISIVIVTLLGLIPSEGNDVLEFLGKPTLSWPIGAATVVILGTSGLLAGYFPARRAASIDPATTLRYE